jgi:hypothetical protein
MPWFRRHPDPKICAHCVSVLALAAGCVTLGFVEELARVSEPDAFGNTVTNIGRPVKCPWMWPDSSRLHDKLGRIVGTA